MKLLIEMLTTLAFVFGCSFLALVLFLMFK